MPVCRKPARYSPIKGVLPRHALLVLLMVLVSGVPLVAPALAHALSGGSLVEVCTSTGTQLVSLDASTGNESALCSHCPLCLPTPDRLAPPPSLVPVSGGLVGTCEGVRHALPVRPALPFLTAIARAPPDSRDRPAA